jgi:hypothetical protein
MRDKISFGFAGALEAKLKEKRKMQLSTATAKPS